MDLSGYKKLGYKHPCINFLSGYEKIIVSTKRCVISHHIDCHVYETENIPQYSFLIKFKGCRNLTTQNVYLSKFAAEYYMEMDEEINSYFGGAVDTYTEGHFIHIQFADENCGQDIFPYLNDILSIVDRCEKEYDYLSEDK